MLAWQSMLHASGPFSLRTVMALPLKLMSRLPGPEYVPSATMTVSRPLTAALIAAWMVRLGPSGAAHTALAPVQASLPQSATWMVSARSGDALAALTLTTRVTIALFMTCSFRIGLLRFVA